MTSRAIFYIFAAALAFVAATNAESTASEETFAEATSFVQAYMSEGKSESACRKVADDAIKTIKDECAALQKTVDTAAKAGSACCNSGKSGVDAAKKANDDMDGKSSTCKSQRKAIASSKIKFDTTIKDLKKRKCNAVFGSRAYKDMKRKLDNKDKECQQLKGSGKEAKKALRGAICAAKESRKKCVTRSKTALKAAFKNADKACSSTQNKKSFTRAMHMKCVLDGKSLGKCGAGKPPTVTKTSFSKLTCPATTVGSIKPCRSRDIAAAAAKAKALALIAKVAAAKAKAKALAVVAKVADAKAKAAKAKAARAEAKAAKAEAKAKAGKGKGKKAKAAKAEKKAVKAEKKAAKAVKKAVKAEKKVAKAKVKVKKVMSFMEKMVFLSGSKTISNPGSAMRKKSLQFLDRQKITCQAMSYGKVLTSFKVADAGGSNSYLKYVYTCKKAGAFKKKAYPFKKTKCRPAKNKKLQYLGRRKVKCPAHQALTEFKFTKKGCSGGGEMRYKYKCADIGANKKKTKRTRCSEMWEKDLEYLDRQKIECPDQMALSGFQVVNCSGNRMRYKFTCVGKYAED